MYVPTVRYMICAVYNNTSLFNYVMMRYVNCAVYAINYNVLEVRHASCAV